MHVCGAHEYRQLYAAAFQVFRLIHLFKGYHAPVCRGYHRVAGVTLELSAGGTVEVHQKQIEDRGCETDYDRYPYEVAEKQPQRYVDEQQCRHEQYQYVCTFAMYLDSHSLK